MRLTGRQKNLLIRALQSWDYIALTMLLNDLDPPHDLTSIASENVGRTNVAYRVQQQAVDEFWAFDLVVAARAERPQDPLLQELYEQLTLGASVADDEQIALQRYYQGQGWLYDPAVLRDQLEQIERRVCRIDYLGSNGSTFGTGFLVGPDVVITNHHVVEDVIANPGLAAAVTLRFDYALDAGGKELPGTPHRLAADGWLLDCSRRSASDTVFSAAPPATSADELDYVLLRLADRAGCERAGGSQRGWIEVPAVAPNLKAGDPLTIMQHPEKDRVKVAFQPASIQTLNPGRTRVRHTTPTKGGSSGAPCFDGEWRLVAVHHVGDPNFDHLAQYNQAITMEAIVDRVQRGGKAALLGGGC